LKYNLWIWRKPYDDEMKNLPPNKDYTDKKGQFYQKKLLTAYTKQKVSCKTSS
jgi:hypothetical protein